MSKLTKLKSNPKLFFADVIKNRKRDMRNASMFLKGKKDKILHNISNDKNILDNSSLLSVDYHNHVDNEKCYVISVIIPSYNAGTSLSLTLDSILAQDIDIDTVEVLIVNDGSTDNTLDIANLYNGVLPNIKIIDKSNGGVSSARNTGIKNAKGKFVMFLDADDTISPNALSSIVNFFEVHQEEIDILTYPLYYVRNGVAKCDHFRYKEILTYTGVYNVDENPFICQTTINVCIKNNQKILFDEGMIVQEDQDFNFNVLLNKRKIGFVKEAGYFYKIDSGSLSNTKNNPLYSFDLFCNYYLNKIDRIASDRYLQSLFLYNLQWRLKSDQLFPYFLDNEDYNKSLDKIKSLINIIDYDLILNFPNLDFFHKFYILKFGNKNIKLQANQENISLICNNDQVIHKEKNIEIIVNKIKIINNSIKFIGVLKSVLFLFYEQKPKLFVVINGDKYELSLSSASESYYKSKIKTGNFFSFSFDKKLSNISNFKFLVEIDGFLYNAKYYFNTFSSINPRIKRNYFYYEDYKLSFENNEFNVLSGKNQGDRGGFVGLPAQHKNIKELAKKIDINEDIWLYYDCKGVMMDNGLFQYLHDAVINDGVSRYFIWNNNIDDLPDIIPHYLRGKFIPFGSMLHKLLILNSKKILTSFIEYNNIYPFSVKDIIYYTDMFHFELVYLQHGILHASMPHKYTQEKMLFDKVVISSHFEMHNFTTKYNVPMQDLILSGMPRFSMVDKKIEPSNRILLAPSWRSYLINYIDEAWQPSMERFVKSKYFIEINSFLSSPTLHEFLSDNDFYLDFQLHPIFQCYADNFNFNNERINIGCSNFKKEDYILFITDFSSFVFDFVYLERPIIYFVPDLIEFRSGLASYRELDLPFENAFGNLTQTASECLSDLLRLHKNNFNHDEVFIERMRAFFLPMKNPVNDIYHICSYNS